LPLLAPYLSFRAAEESASAVTVRRVPHPSRFGEGWDVNPPPTTEPLLLPLPLLVPLFVIPQRSGGICFFPFAVHLSQPQKPNRINASKNIPSKTAQKSHVKPLTHLTPYQSTTSKWKKPIPDPLYC
jgi:hypothetical protein